MAADIAGRIVLRWDSTADCAPILQSGGIDAVWLREGAENVAASCRAAGVESLPPGAIRLLRPEEHAKAGPGEAVAVKAAAWPAAEAARRTGDGAVVASATSRAWVTANGWLIAWLRALYPGREPLLAYTPAESGRALPFDSLEVALVDAWTVGGNCILAPDGPYRDALLRGDKTALAAWSRMGAAARWLKQHRALFRQPPLRLITVLVDRGDASAEIANLMFRQSASPDLISTNRVPPPDPANRPVVAAAGIAAPSAELARLLLAHARAGATVMTDHFGKEAWWRTAAPKPVRAFDDREFYALGSGRIVAYKEPVADPGDFALDALDLAAGRRPARLWNCPAGVAIASRAAAGGKAALHIVNYGSPLRGQFLARRYGVFRSATLLRPGEPDQPLRTYKRGGSTEVVVPGLARVGVVLYD